MTAQQLHYGLCTLATLALVYQYAVHQHFDVGYGSFCLGFWVTAVGNDKYNTPNPNVPG